MPEAFDVNRTVDYNANTRFKLNQTPGILYPLAGSASPYEGASCQIEDQFDDDFNLQDKQVANEDTNNRDATSDRRWIKKPRSANVAPIRDRDAMLATRVDIDSPLVAGTAKGVRRYHDDMFIQGFFGNAYTGETGDTAVPFASGNYVPVNLTGSNTGLVKDKLIRIAEMFELADVDTEAEQPIMIITPKQKSDLMKIAEYVDADYKDDRPLAMREVKPFQGIRFIVANLGSATAYPRSSALTLSGSTRKCPVFVPSGLHRGVWTEFFGRIDERADKSYSKQVFAEACSTVTRLMENKCYYVECLES